jgi:peptide/nickel transport system ATP-binding protein
MFISHDLSTVASFADRIMVLYAGRVVEDGSTRNILALPSHPYTQLLLSSIPELRQGWLEDVMNTRAALAGIARAVEITDVGCPFYPRCPIAIDGVCDTTPAPCREPVPGHRIACHRELAELIAFEQEL